MIEKVFSDNMCQVPEDNHVQSETLNDKDIKLTDAESTLKTTLDTNSNATLSETRFETEIADSDNHIECGKTHLSLLYYEK